jgi:hypothetical protein
MKFIILVLCCIALTLGWTFGHRDALDWTYYPAVWACPLWYLAGRSDGDDDCG